MAWLQGVENAPLLVRRCVESWTRHNPGWEVRVLREEDMGSYTSFDHTVGPVRDQIVSHRTNLLRTDLLATHGGVWADVTCYCTRPLDDWLPASVGPSGYFAFARPGFDRPFDNWFQAAQPSNYIVTRQRDFLRDHMARPLRQASKPFKALLNFTPWTRGLWFSRPVRDWLGLEPYYANHYAFELLLRKDPEFARVWHETPKISARGPLALKWGGFWGSLVASSAGLFAPLSDEGARELEKGEPPLHKLNYKFEGDAVPPGSVLDYILHNEPSSRASA